MTDQFPRPKAPGHIKDLGIELGLLQNLALKTLYYEGSTTADAIARRIALPLSPAVEILDSVRKERLCEILGSESEGAGGYRYALTNAGLTRVLSALEQSGYAGPVPVPLTAYIDSIKKQSIRTVKVTRTDIERSLSRMVLDQHTVDLIGQALQSERAMLLYGDTGNGKTSIAECLREVLPGHMLIPHAIEVMHQVIQLYDPSTHEILDVDGSAGEHDRRWIAIRRPVVFAAAELAASHLELIRDDVNKTYEAPIQLKANGGIMVIDDFGRQQLDAAYLLNRWIVPLENGIDHLSLANGARFQVPFDSIPLFVTNNRPAELADDAFLRRIRYKIEIPGPTETMFLEILRRECARNEVAYDDAAAHHMLKVYFKDAGRPLRGCNPRDLVEAIADAARYRGAERALNERTIREAAASYFV
jgi:predicted ATPase with chaperone activity